MRDHRLGFPAALLADTPAENTARYPLGRPTRDPEPQTWPFPLVKPAVTFVADSRTMDSDRPQPVVLGVDMGKPEKPAQAEPQADAEGWIEHKPGPRPAHLKAGMKVELKWNSAINDTNMCVLQDPFGNGWEDGIVAYRVVTA